MSARSTCGGGGGGSKRSVSNAGCELVVSGMRV